MNRPHCLALALVVAMLGNPCRAQSATADFPAPECPVRLERNHDGWPPSLRLRPGCRLGIDSTREALSALVTRLPPAGAAATKVSVYIGRIVDYPWLSEALARAAGDSPKWSARRGRLLGEDRLTNAFIATLLRDDAVLRGLLPGWRLTGVSVEKVLVGPAERALPTTGLRGWLPFDAMCWLELRRDRDSKPASPGLPQE